MPPLRWPYLTEGFSVAAYRSLRERLGRAARFSLNIPRIQDGDSDITVRWRCGCTAAGENLNRITLRVCRKHAALPSELGLPVLHGPGDAA